MKLHRKRVISDLTLWSMMRIAWFLWRHRSEYPREPNNWYRSECHTIRFGSIEIEFWSTPESFATIANGKGYFTS